MKKYLEDNRKFVVWGLIIGASLAVILDRRRIIIPEKMLKHMAKTGEGTIFPTSHGLLVMKFFTEAEIAAAGSKIH